MAFSGGNFSLYVPGNPVVTGTAISSAWANATLSDIATGLSTCILKDGSQTLTGNIPMGGFKLTGLAAGTGAGDSLRYEQLVGAYLPITGGTLTGNLLFTDATYDIGASGATRPRDLFLSRNAVIGGTLGVTGATTLSAALTYGGVTLSNAVTGTGAMVLATSPSLTTPALGTPASGVLTACTAATQTALDNSTKLATTAYVNAVSKYTLVAEQAAASTSMDFGSIPAGVKRISINLVGLSTSGNSTVIIQLGDAGGPEPSGYLSSCAGALAGTVTQTTSTAGFIIDEGTNQALTSTRRGTITLSLEDASDFTWCASGTMYDSGSGSIQWFAGSKSLSAELTSVRITTSGGTNTFDAGVANITYE